MWVTLADLVAAADRQGCPIIHISKLAGHEPLVPNQPCLGEATGSLVDLDDSDYLAVMAEFRRRFVVEAETELPEWLHTAGGAAAELEQRPRLAGRLISGILELDREPVAATYLLDGAGQETTLIYRQLPTMAAVRSYWLERAGYAPPLHAS